VATCIALASLLGAAGCGEDDDLTPVFDACTEGVAPDAACYASKRQPASAQVKLATEIAAGYMARHKPETLKWDWGDGVLMYAMVELHRVTGDKRLLAYFKAWIDHHLVKGYDLVWSDSCPPALAAQALAAQPGAAAKYQKVADDVVAYFKAAPRTDEGGISHMGKALPLIKTLWLDSLFMVGMPVAREGERAGDATLLDAVSKQYQVFAAALQGSGGLLKHAHNWQGQEAGVFWGRGNAWITAAGHDYLRARRLRGERDDAVQAILDRQAAAVASAQDPKTGLWWTVLNQPGKSYLETSASALFAYGLARGFRYGAREATVLPLVKKAVAGVKTRIVKGKDGTPVVEGTSGPTMVGDAAYYAGIKRESDLHYGVGAVILMLLETSGLW